MTFPTPTLDEWGRDLRNLAEQGRLADAIGREREIEQMITVLARTQKSNPILLGEAGVGKTAIVEALAWRVAQGAVPPLLQGKRIVELFKQNQYNPFPVEVQSAILWAMQNNLLDDVPVEKVKDFQAKMTDFLATRKAALLGKIRAEKAFSDALAAELKVALTEFKQTYR